MSKISVKPGYYEWNVWVNDEIAWTDGDPVEYLFNDQDPYEVDEYVNLCVSCIRQMVDKQDLVEGDSNVNFEIINNLTETDFEEIRKQYIKALRQVYGY